MGLLHKKDCQHLLSKSRSMERLDRWDSDTKTDPKKLYTSNISREVTPETLFKEEFATSGKRSLLDRLRGNKLTLVFIGVGLFILVMILLLLV